MVGEIKCAVVVGGVLVVDQVHHLRVLLVAQDIPGEQVVVAQASLQAEEAPLRPATRLLLALCLSIALLHEALQPNQLLLHLVDAVALAGRDGRDGRFCC